MHSTPVKVFALTVALVAATIASVLAQSRTAAKPQPANKNTAQQPNAAAPAALPEAERQAIENDLIWTGDYNGAINADLNARAVAAVKAFQKRIKAKETGVLDAKERAALAAAAQQKRDAAGWSLQDDHSTGARIGLPIRLVPLDAIIIGGARWRSANANVQVETFRIVKPGATLQSVYDSQSKVAERKITYKLARPDFFVLTGMQGAKKFYVRAAFRNGEVRGFTIVYDPKIARMVDPIVIAMSNAYMAFPAKAIAIVPPPRRKVEYGTGVIVSPKGDVLTSRELLEGCEVVTLAGLGPADTIASDKASGLALLRIYGAHKLAPLALADPAPTAELTLVGIADPQSQAGGDKVSVAPARVRAATASAPAAIEPPPQIGFAGAAALDRHGRLGGIVDPPPQFVVAGPPAPDATKLIPVGAVRTLLGAQHVPADAGTAGTDAAKSAVVRIICVRK
jgi:hypothetical protein